MMLHRHFEQTKNENITTLKDVTPRAEFVSEIFGNNSAETADEIEGEIQPKRGRRKKNEE